MLRIYVSPFKLFQLHPEEISAEQVRRVKRRLVSEIELSKNGSIRIGDADFTRSDIETISEELLQPERFRLHRYVHEDPALLAFLTGSVMTPLHHELPAHYATNAAYRDFLRPYLVAQADQRLASYLRKDGHHPQLLLGPVQRLRELQSGSEDFPELKRVLQADILEMNQLSGKMQDIRKIQRLHYFFSPLGLLPLQVIPPGAAEIREAYWEALLSLLQRSSGHIFRLKRTLNIIAGLLNFAPSEKIRKQMVRLHNEVADQFNHWQPGLGAWLPLNLLSVFLLELGFRLGNHPLFIIAAIVSFLVTMATFMKTLEELLRYQREHPIRNSVFWRIILTFFSFIGMPVFWLRYMNKQAGPRRWIIVSLYAISTLLAGTGTFAWLLHR